MGKVKRTRQKFHQPAKAASEDAGGDGPSMTPVAVLAQISSFFSETGTDVGKQQQRKDARDDCKSVVSSRTGEILQVSKKDKRKLRHERFLEKIEAIQIARRNQVERCKRSRTAVVGDMQPLANALPELGHLCAAIPENASGSKSVANKPQRSNSNKITKSKRKKILEDELSRHAQVLSHPAFKADPFAAISEHLRNKMKQEELEHMERS